MSTPQFSYEEFITRNLGFVNQAEQDKLRASRVLIIGVGGMGGTALATLARIGIEHFVIADIDFFEVSNLNRQIFSNLSTINRDKAQVAREEVLKINPNIKLEVLGAEWLARLPELLQRVDVVINGCDDVKSTITLMRLARDRKKTVIDAFASTLPSVYVVRPSDPRPEETFGYPTAGLQLSEITPALEKACAAKEIEYVATHSTSIRHVHLEYIAEMMSGKRKRISFAPMVWMTSILMAYETVKILLDRKTQVDHRGIFLNPWTLSYERPLPAPLAAVKRRLVRYYISKLGK